MTPIAHSLVSALLRAGVDWLVTVPTSHLDELYDSFGARGRCILATREEEAVAIAAGLATGGQSPFVVMQQSGVGNALNAVFTLADAYEIAFPILVIHRGQGDPNPIQRVSAAATVPILKTLNVRVVNDWSQQKADSAISHAQTDPEARWLLFDPKGEL